MVYRRAVAFLMALTTVAGAYGMDTAADGEPVTGLLPAPLREVEVEGLRRTRQSVVLDLISLQEGELVTADTIRTVEDEIIDSGIFSEVQVTPIRPADEPETVDLLVTIREKWTLIPLPFFTTDGTSTSGGLILIESNLLGRRKQLISAAFGGSEGFSGFFAYVDPSVLGTPWSGRLSAATGRSDRDHVLPDGRRIRSYTAQQTTVGAGVGYRLTREVRATTGLRIIRRELSSFEQGIDATEPAGGTTLEPDFTVRYDGTRQRGVLRTGLRVQGAVRVATGNNVSHDPGWEYSGDAELAVPVVPSLQGRARVLLSGGIARMSPTDKQGISARDGFRTLPYQQTVADRWFSSAALIDLPVLRRSWGAIVLSHFWESGFFDDPAHDLQYFGGPGGGFRVFLQEVAIPAMGLDIAYNMVEPGIVFSLTVGARM